MIEPLLEARQVMAGVKFAVALAGTALFLWGIVLRRLGRPDAFQPLRDRVLVTLGLVAAACWWNFGKFHFDAYPHLWEQYHYYVGAKYFGELGYTKLYECTTVADVEAGLGDRVLRRKIRDERTNAIGSAVSIVAHPERCTAIFTPERWTAFKNDVAYFRARTPAPVWERVFRDHGYNASPAWGILGITLANLVSASDGTILALALLDVVLLLGMWAFVIQTFGWRVASVGLLWWGTNQLSEFSWTGGGFLRQDWLALSIAAICLARRGRMLGAGFALTYAALLRVFPALIVAGLVLRVLTRIGRERSWSIAPAHRRFALGGLLALGVVFSLSLALPGGLAAWRSFVENTRANLRSTGTNTVGLMTLLCYEHDNRQERMLDPSLENPQSAWLAAKRDVFQRRRVLQALLALGFLVLLARAVRDEDDWVALALGIGFIPIGSFVVCYYYSVLAGYALLAERRLDSIGALICGLAAFSRLAYWAFGSPIEYDQRYALDSLAVVFVVAATTLLWRRWSSPLTR